MDVDTDRKFLWNPNLNEIRRRTTNLQTGNHPNRFNLQMYGNESRINHTLAIPFSLVSTRLMSCMFHHISPIGFPSY